MAFAAGVGLRTTGRGRLANRARFSCSQEPKPGKDLDTSVYVVTDRRLAGPRGVLYAVERALEGEGLGRRATIVQLRDKGVAFEESVRLGRSLRAATRRAGALLIVNDDVELAEAVDADGLHVGQEDAAAAAVRGRVRILGVSAGTAEEAVRAVRDGADYVGVGAVYGTSTKKDAGPPIGLEGLRAVARAVGGRCKVVAIGGVGPGNAEDCARAGADGVAVVSAVMAAEDPAAAVTLIAAAMERGLAIGAEQ